MNSTSKSQTPPPKGPWGVIAWSIWGLSLIFTALGVVFLALSFTTPMGVRWGLRGYTAMFAVTYGTVGALVVARRPRNRIGWILCYIGLFNGIQAFVEEYAVYALLTRSDSSPAVMWVAWIQTWFWVLAAIPIILLPLVFPDGRLVSPRWRLAVWLAALSVALLLFGVAFMPGPLQPFTDLMNPYAIGGDGGFMPLLYGAAFALLAVTALTGVAAMFVRFRRSKGEERQQLKWFTYAAAFVAITVAVFGDEPTVGALFITVAMLAIPLATGIAILRYRLWDIDIIINRTLVYVPLTAILAGVYAASISLSQQLFVALIGEESDAAIVLTTLVVISAFTPIQNGLQSVVDKHFKAPRDPTKTLKTLSAQVQSVVQVMDIEQITRRLLDEAVRAFDAEGGTVHLDEAGQSSLVYTQGDWKGVAEIAIPLESDGAPVGTLALGARRDGSAYGPRDRETLQQAGQLVARAIALVRRAR